MSTYSQSVRPEVLDAFQESDGWVTAATIAAKAGVSHSPTRDYLNEFVEQDLADRRQTPINPRVVEFRYIGMPEWFDP